MITTDEISALVAEVLRTIDNGFTVEVYCTAGRPEQQGYRLLYRRRIRCPEDITSLDTQVTYATTLEGALRQVLAIEARRDEQLRKRYAGAGGEGGEG